MEVEQVVDAIVERPELAPAHELGARPGPVQHVGTPQSVEILVDAPRGERIGRVERPIGGDVREADRERSTQRSEPGAEQPVERDRAADLVAMRERLQEDVRPRARRFERPGVREPGVAGGPGIEIGNLDLDLGYRALLRVKCARCVHRLPTPQSMQTRSASRRMNASQRASCSTLTHSFGWCACAMCPGPQMMAGMPAS